MASKINYTVTRSSDGGYVLNIVLEKRHWKPITSEGIFPKERKTYVVKLLEKGQNFSFRNQEGFYYSDEKIISEKKAWDFGYAWVDAKRKHIYLNMYWVTAPTSITPSDVNGSYEIPVVDKIFE